MADAAKVRMIYDEVLKHAKEKNIGCFKGMDKDIFLVSETYSGIWVEHIYDSIVYSDFDPYGLELAINAINLFIDKQTEEGQYPCYVWDGNKHPEVPEEKLSGYTQIQEVVSFARLCLMVYRRCGDKAFLEKAYNAGTAWDGWLRKYRMTTNRGLIEMFCGFDTGHDNSGRNDGISCPRFCTIDGEEANASAIPPEDGITPILAVDMNSNFYSTQRALAEMARILGREDEATVWEKNAEEIKKKIFEYCYDENDGFFYDVDKNGNKRRIKSSAVLHLFLERVLDREEDADVIETLCNRYIKNPDEFWTTYPFPGVSVADPTWKTHKMHNSWGYYSQATIALRCSFWMDYYGMSDDFDVVCERWLECYTKHYDTIKLGQEFDPVTGEPSEASEWYSGGMMLFAYAARRLKYV